MASKIVLISFANPVFSMGVNSLDAVLNIQGYDTAILYFVPRIKMFQTFESFSSRDYDALVQKCIELNPDIIGISVFSSFFYHAAKITTLLREKLKKKCLIVWGGIHPTLDPEGSLKYADAVCVGEGENTIIELLKALKGDIPIGSVRNLWIKSHGGIIKKSVVQHDDLDALPLPAHHNRNKFVLNKGTIAPLKRQLSFYSIMTSRGCFFSCSYCSNSNLKQICAHYRVRRRSVDNVLKELHDALKANPRISRIYFYDDVFTFDKDWIDQFAQRYKEEIALPFFCYTHPKTVNEEIIKILKQCGCSLLSMGIQGSSKRMRSIYNRKTSDDEIISACNIINRYHFDEFYMDIIFSPFDTPQDMEEGLRLLLQLPKPFYISMHALTFFPKAPITEMAYEKKMISDNDIVSNMETPPHQFGNYLNLLFTPQGKWWYLYFVCGKRVIPNFLIKISKGIPGIPFMLFALFKILERIPLMITRRNVFTR